ncbi:hypothetical protein [Neorhizobium alkalisoli]|uniref:hypothetical protein n=1 Tax=Neorhizobium alkalisoli TaxID=528178 RepID=UPI00131A312A|nr:hypothetical protein [Neorhizobium alkalisoli]
MTIRNTSSGSAPRNVASAEKASQEAASGMAPRQPAVIEILPPEPKVTAKPLKPLSFQAVERILERAIENNDLDGIWAELIEWDKLTDGTTVGVVEDQDTCIRYHWTVCPKTFEPLNLGPIDA